MPAAWFLHDSLRARIVKKHEMQERGKPCGEPVSPAAVFFANDYMAAPVVITRITESTDNVFLGPIDLEIGKCPVIEAADQRHDVRIGKHAFKVLPMTVFISRLVSEFVDARIIHPAMHKRQVIKRSDIQGKYAI